MVGSSGNDVPIGNDGVIDNEYLDGGFGASDTCTSNPDHEIHCEI